MKTKVDSKTMTTELTNEQLQALLQSPDLAEKLASLGGDAIQTLTKAATDAAEVQKEREAAERKQKIASFLDDIDRKLEEEGIARDEFAVAIAARFKLSTKSARTQNSDEAVRKNAPTRPKYKIILNDNEHVWSGKGRAPLAFKAAKEDGELEQYRMTDEEVQAYMQAHPKKYGLE
jgi:DNA-binding protein H-NS